MTSGLRSSNVRRGLGLAAAVVGVVGYVAFGWRFGDGGSGGLPFALGIAFCAVAVGLTIVRRR